MGSPSRQEAIVDPAPVGTARRRASGTIAARRPTSAEIAWLVALPTALVAVLAIWLVGPALGRAVSGDRPAVWPTWGANLTPEPNEQGRFLIALAAPLLLSALMIAVNRRPPQLPPARIAALVTAVQLIALAFVAVCFVAQWQLEFGFAYSAVPDVTLRDRYFTPATLAVAAAATALAVVLLRRPAALRRIGAWTRERPRTRILASAAAVIACGVWLLQALYTETSIADAHFGVLYHVGFTLDETFAVLNGRSPLVDFAAQYGSLWPYAFAAAMSLLGETAGVWIGLAVALTGAAMVAMYAVLRRLTRNSVAALLLFLPFLATSFFVMEGPLDNRYSYGNYFGTFPMRYAGPFVLAWLLVRHLDGARPTRSWPLFLASGLVLLNNVDVGLPALAALVAALLWTGGAPGHAGARRVALEALAGLALAFALVCSLTLLRTGSLPHLELLFRYARIFTSGFGQLPMPTLGLHVVIYLTFVATIGLATVRAIGGRRRTALTGMLAFSGVFGLGVGAYYVGRSHPENLISTFSAWSLAISLLLVAVVPDLVRRARDTGRDGRVRPSVAQVACLFAFFVATCSLAQTPVPWEQISRLYRPGTPDLAAPAEQAFVAQYAEEGEPVVILTPLGHRIGANLGVTNVALYTGSLSMPMPSQLDETIDALRRSGGRKIFLSPVQTWEDVVAAIERAGFRLDAAQGSPPMQLWSDTGP